MEEEGVNISHRGLFKKVVRFKNLSRKKRRPSSKKNVMFLSNVVYFYFILFLFFVFLFYSMAENTVITIRKKSKISTWTPTELSDLWQQSWPGNETSRNNGLGYK